MHVMVIHTIPLSLPFPMSFFKTGTWYLLRNMGFVSASMFAGDVVCQKILKPNEPWLLLLDGV